MSAKTARKRAARSSRPKSGPSRVADVVTLPTPERVAKAGEAFVMGKTLGCRVEDAPIERLHARGVLNRDPDIARMLYEAALRFRADWFHSGLAGVGAIDYGKVHHGCGDSPSGMPTTEWAARCRQSFRGAYRAMEPDERTVVGGIVCDERPVHDVGCQVYGPRRRAVILEGTVDLLRGGLKNLARHYRLDGRN